MTDSPANRAESSAEERIRDLEGTVEGQDRYIVHLKSLLAEVQWIGFGWCPICGGENDEGHGHYKSCRLALALSGSAGAPNAGRDR